MVMQPYTKLTTNY